MFVKQYDLNPDICILKCNECNNIFTGNYYIYRMRKYHICNKCQIKKNNIITEWEKQNENRKKDR